MTEKENHKKKSEKIKNKKKKKYTHRLILKVGDRLLDRLIGDLDRFRCNGLRVRFLTGDLERDLTFLLIKKFKIKQKKN